MSFITMPPKQGDIVRVDFPFTNWRNSKERNAVIISRDSYNNPDYAVAFITGEVYAGALDFRVTRSHTEFADTGLTKDSTFRIGKIVICHVDLIKYKIGFAGPIIQGEINKRVKLLFGV